MARCRMWRLPSLKVAVTHLSGGRFENAAPEIQDAVFALARKEAPDLDGAVSMGNTDDNMLPWHNKPNFRRYRRNAARWLGADITDDLRVTTEQEAEAATLWKEKREIESPSAPSVMTRKVARARFDLLTDEELDSIVTEWRVSTDAPAESKFTPPADRNPVPRIVKRT